MKAQDMSPEDKKQFLKDLEEALHNKDGKTVKELFWVGEELDFELSHKWMEEDWIRLMKEAENFLTEFELKVIDPILNCIKDNQEYLTQKENLPQLAKLGYMYNTLWYAGRVCWGSGGKIRVGFSCEDNPKYKIEMCEPLNETIDNYIYDAWGMHVSNEGNESWEDFENTVLGQKELSEIEKMSLKPNKTLEDWIEIKTHPDYQYKSLYKDRRRIVDYLLCTIGTGYGYAKGYIFEEASGADQDSTNYGDWVHATFREDIQTLVNELMALPEVKQTIVTSYEYINNIKEEEKKKTEDRETRMFGMPFEEYLKSPQALLNLNSLREKHNLAPVDEWTTEASVDVFMAQKGQTRDTAAVSSYRPYYPICEYSNITKFDKNTHPSYIQAGIEVCEEILKHETEERPQNVKFAKKYLKQFKPKK